jgi:hypothetical protein
MSDFWTFGGYVSWEHCIEANRICNLDICPDTMNCCVSNCIGMPTLKGIVLMLSITILTAFFLWVFSIVHDATKKTMGERMAERLEKELKQ